MKSTRCGKGKITNAYSNMDESHGRYVEQKKLDTKEYIPQKSITSETMVIRKVKIMFNSSLW